MLSEKERKELRREAKRKRATAYLYIPVRGETPPFAASSFDGLPGGILEVNGITDVELSSSGSTNADRAVDSNHQKDNSTTTRVLASNDHGVEPLGGPNVANDSLRAVSGAATKTKTFDGYHMKDLAFGDRVMAGMDAGKLIGNIPDANIPNIGKGKLPNDTVYTGSDGKIAVDLLPGIGSLKGALHYKALKGKPNLGKFLTSKDIQNRATFAWVKAYVTKHVKPTARR